MKKDQAVQSPAGRLRARRKKRIMIALAAAVVILAAVVIGVCVQVFFLLFFVGILHPQVECIL